MEGLPPNEGNQFNQNVPIPPNRGKKLTAIVLIAAVIAVAGIFAAGSKLSLAPRNSASKPPAQPVASPSFQASLKPGEVKEADKGSVPEEFPRELLAEPDAATLKNYNSLNPEGKLLAVREYISRQTVEQNVAVFLDIFKKEGWTVLDNIKQPEQVILTADKANSRARVIISKYEPTGKSKVFISNLFR